jgi:cytochrome c-type biogenesis protein CcmH
MVLKYLYAFALLIALFCSSPLWAVQPNEVLSDPTLETRARTLSKQLRCLVCQNESIDDSEAPLAHDLRVIVRERLNAGDSDAQVMDFLVARYGEFVLLRPRLSWHSAALWGLPPALLLFGIVIVIIQNRRQNAGFASSELRSLTKAEEARVAELLRDQGAS